ncbi:hypothetical protein C427_1931 [Paraglaciecola psychrophila 170]|uniref:Uncharacterized protein n=1 Tax=Paraglaciecola psychrophila 170 TaxID=1129794 RepID=K6YV75_9ALTE|nr:hypothetical protein C427_1931 [Paraglaciecola psychrophila 170]GAC36614.1 hypothetical protein GPSY_0976 [Paraglaciecola psychrophila 170]
MEGVDIIRTGSPIINRDVYGAIHIKSMTDFTLWLEEKMSLGQLLKS